MRSLLELQNGAERRDADGVLWGNQEPRIRSVPPSDFSLGVEAIELAETAGLILDPWQQLAVLDALAEGDDGIWAAFEVAILVARQNGKGSILEAIELAKIFLFGDRLIIHTAHEFKTAGEAYLRIKFLIENTPELHKKVRQYHGSHGEEGISFKSGARLRFLARSKGSGRGFTADTLIYDEAYELPAASVAASLPTLSARPNPQVYYTSSAPLLTSDTLREIRKRGLHQEGMDWSSLAFLEWSANLDGYDVVDGKRIPLDLDDRRGWSDANPGLGRRIREMFILKERAAMTDADFSTERLGITDEPKVHAVLNPDRWDALRDPDSQPLDPVTFAIDANPERTWASIAVAGMRADGLVHVELGDRRRGLNWVPDRMVELVQDWEPKMVVIDAMSPAAALLPQLAERGIEVHVTGTTEYARACGSFFDMYEAGRLRHLGQNQLTAATEIASKRLIGDGGAWGWSRRDAGDISPLVAGTLAAFGYFLARAETEEPVDNKVHVFRRR
jgi:hypothetical protein